MSKLKKKNNRFNNLNNKDSNKNKNKIKMKINWFSKTDLIIFIFSNKNILMHIYFYIIKIGFYLRPTEDYYF
jgi:hypothetical protein